jgi:hypothetical protein
MATLVGLVAYFAAYLASVLTSLGILWLNDRASAPVFVVVAIFVAIVVAIPSGVLWMKQWGHRLPARWVRRLPGAALLLKAIAEAPTDLLHDPVLLAETVTLEFSVSRSMPSRYGWRFAPWATARRCGSPMLASSWHRWRRPWANPAWPGHVRGGLRRDAQPARRSNRNRFGGDALAARTHLLAAHAARFVACQA